MGNMSILCNINVLHRNTSMRWLMVGKSAQKKAGVGETAN
jgi:hypothetical protein